MIISASRRTDIPSFYSEWFCNRLRAGYVLVRNPMNARQVSKIALTPDVVDGFVFWTKNPIPMLHRLDRLQDYPFYFQFTLTAYGADVERSLPDKRSAIIPAFQQLSKQIGSDRVIWRYDPIFLSDRYTPAYHAACFEALAQRLRGYTRKCTISFLDYYRNTAKRLSALSLWELPPARQAQLAQTLAAIARRYGLELETCAEDIDLAQYGVGHASCVDGRLFSRLLGCPLTAGKDKNQRPACGCVESIDIGAYNTCRNGCLYCYANHSTPIPGGHDPEAPLLIGALHPDDVVTERKLCSFRDPQLRLPL